MIDKNKREEYEKWEGVIERTASPKDGLPPGHLYADPNCETCQGHGVLDEGHFTGVVWIRCPDCWNK